MAINLLLNHPPGMVIEEFCLATGNLTPIFFQSPALWKTIIKLNTDYEGIFTIYYCLIDYY